MPILTTTELREVLNLFPHWYRTVKVPVRHIQSFKYRFGKHRKQYFLLLLPDASIPLQDKLIIYYHGGGWRTGTPEMFKANAKVFLDQGYPVIMPSHRKVPKYKYQAIREDLSTCLVKILEVLPKHQLQEKKLILGGMSSGGNLAAHLLYDQTSLLQLGLFQNLFSCVVHL